MSSRIAGGSSIADPQLYPAQMTIEMRTRLSNSLLIGDIIGMLVFGLLSDRIGRRWGIVGCTLLLVGGVLLATAAHGRSIDGMLWMMVVSALHCSCRMSC